MVVGGDGVFLEAGARPRGSRSTLRNSFSGVGPARVSGYVRQAGPASVADEKVRGGAS